MRRFLDLWRTLPMLALAALVAVTASLSTAPAPAFAFGSQTYKDPNPGCPKYTIAAYQYRPQPSGTPNVNTAVVYADVAPTTQPVISATAMIMWENFSSPYIYTNFGRGDFGVDTHIVDSTGKVKFGYIETVSPGQLSFTMIGTATMANGQVCVIPEGIVTWAEIGGTDHGVTWDGREILPITADVDGDGLTDDSHCGTICDKKKDLLVEKQEDKLRVKVCYELGHVKGHPEDSRAFKACKQSGLNAIKAREGRGWDCWYATNRNGWTGPTAPENAPKEPNGATYQGTYFGKSCGYNVPAQPTLPVSTQDATPSDPTLTDQGTVPDTLLPELYMTTSGTLAGDTVAPGDSVFVDWSNIPNAGTNDWIVLYKADGTAMSTRRYTNSCASTVGTGVVANGSCTIPLPSSASSFPGGFYHFRLYHNAGNTDADLVQTSNDFERILSNCELNPNNCSE